MNVLYIILAVVMFNLIIWGDDLEAFGEVNFKNIVELPEGSTYINNLGNGWITFRLKDDCFLMFGNNGTASKLARIKC